MSDYTPELTRYLPNQRAPCHTNTPTFKTMSWPHSIESKQCLQCVFRPGRVCGAFIGAQMNILGCEKTWMAKLIVFWSFCFLGGETILLLFSLI